MTLLKVTKKYTNFAVNDLAALWVKRSVKHGRAANHMWIRSANPPTLRMDFLGSIAEPKKSPVWYLSSTNSCDYQISFWCTICLNTVCQYSQQIGSCSLPPSCLMTHMFQICFTICFIGISQALQVGSEWHHMTSHELFRQPPP